MLLEAMRSADRRDYRRSRDYLRAAMEIEFTPEIARALHRVELLLAQKEPQQALLDLRRYFEHLLTVPAPLSAEPEIPFVDEYELIDDDVEIEVEATGLSEAGAVRSSQARGRKTPGVALVAVPSPDAAAGGGESPGPEAPGEGAEPGVTEAASSTEGAGGFPDTGGLEQADKSIDIELEFDIEDAVEAASAVVLAGEPDGNAVTRPPAESWLGMASMGQGGLGERLADFGTSDGGGLEEVTANNQAVAPNLGTSESGEQRRTVEAASAMESAASSPGTGAAGRNPTSTRRAADFDSTESRRASGAIRYSPELVARADAAVESFETRVSWSSTGSIRTSTAGRATDDSTPVRRLTETAAHVTVEADAPPEARLVAPDPTASAVSVGTADASPGADSLDDTGLDPAPQPAPEAGPSPEAVAVVVATPPEDPNEIDPNAFEAAGIQLAPSRPAWDEIAAQEAPVLSPTPTVDLAPLASPMSSAQGAGILRPPRPKQSAEPHKAVAQPKAVSTGVPRMESADEEARRSLLNLAREFTRKGAFDDALALIDDLMLSSDNDIGLMAIRREILTERLARAKRPLESLGRVARLRLTEAELRETGLDRREMFMLSLVDGTTSLQDIIDLSGMPADEARQVLSGLLERRVITAR